MGLMWLTPCRLRSATTHPHIKRCRLYPPEAEGQSFRAYIASKRRYFYGLRVHVVVSGKGEPVEFSVEAGSESDIEVFKKGLHVDLPQGSTVHADKGYTDYATTRTSSKRSAYI
jgi:Transposase DDE domain